MSKCTSQYAASDPRHIIDCWDRCDESLVECHGNWNDETSAGCVRYLREEAGEAEKEEEPEEDKDLRFTPHDDGWIDTWGESPPSIRGSVSVKYTTEKKLGKTSDDDDDDDEDEYDSDSESHIVLPQNGTYLVNGSSVKNEHVDLAEPKSMNGTNLTAGNIPDKPLTKNVSEVTEPNVLSDIAAGTNVSEITQKNNISDTSSTEELLTLKQDIKAVSSNVTGSSGTKGTE